MDSRPAVIMRYDTTKVPAAQDSQSAAVDNPASGVSRDVAAANPDASAGMNSGNKLGDKPEATSIGRLVSRDPSSAATHPEAVYGKEIEMLQTIVRERKAQLDPATVAVIEKNLEIIDRAIDQSRAALAKDPASILLSEQLSHALDKKVDLLRTAAMLPVST
jgi:hypothetical protein